ncbi:DUF1761 domain-containing protein [Candidatus Peregrinibacteria bacterium]|nr:DUF1761 domain-containing protein [Candidatus Peregrinibacteria bacterium]
MVEVNYLAVLVSGVAAMLLGATWYGPLFGKVWMQGAGIKAADIEKAKKRGMALSYLVNFVAALLMAYVLAHFLKLIGVAEMKAGLEMAFWVWLGFIATIQLGSVLWEMKSMKYYLVNAVYYLFSFLMMAAILTAWV